jgi:lysozyme family protein
MFRALIALGAGLIAVILCVRARRIPDRHCRLEAARRAQLRTARGFGAGQTLSIDRPPTEAQAILTPALDGFAPTSQMPEIAEAEALSRDWRKPASGDEAISR